MYVFRDQKTCRKGGIRSRSEDMPEGWDHLNLLSNFWKALGTLLALGASVLCAICVVSLALANWVELCFEYKQGCEVVLVEPSLV